MSTTTKKASSKGVRYTDAQKKEVVDFANDYNSSNGRGGQAKAAEKFKISALTISSWLKAGGAPSSKASKSPAKASKAPKSPKTPKAKSKVGSRYSDEQKKEVTDFVSAYNAANGRGGPSKASKKFGVSPLTVTAWLKASGANGAASKKGGRLAGKISKGSLSGGMSAKLNSLLELSKQIAAAEANLSSLQGKFNSLKASL